MNKERIEQLVLEAACGFLSYHANRPREFFLPEDSIKEFAIDFLARVDEERAKEGPVAWMFTDNEDNNHKSFRQTQPTPEQVEYLAEWGRPSWKPLYLHPQPIPEGHKLVPVDQSREGWKEAAIAWEVCASIHRKYAEGKDALFTTRQGDFVRHAETAREAMLAAAPEVKP